MQTNNFSDDNNDSDNNNQENYLNNTLLFTDKILRKGSFGKIYNGNLFTE